MVTFHSTFWQDVLSKDCTGASLVVYTFDIKLDLRAINIYKVDFISKTYDFHQTCPRNCRDPPLRTEIKTH